MAAGRPREALALWRGPPLDDVAGEPFAAAEIRRLEELRLAAVELAIDARPGRRPAPRGASASSSGWWSRSRCASAARAADAGAVPLRPPGRRARGLPPRPRRCSSSACGVEPGPELRRLHEAILRQDAALARTPLHRSARRRAPRAASRPSGRRCVRPRTTWRPASSSCRRARARELGRLAQTTSSSARSRAWRRSTSRTPSSSSAASGSSPSWSRGSPARR